MKTIEDVIHLEVKIFMRFLKENYILAKFLAKMWNENNYKAPKSLNEYIDLINHEQKRYTTYYPVYKILEDKAHTIRFIIKNDNLLTNTLLFCYWTGNPLILSQNNLVDEGRQWCDLKNKFIFFKKQLNKINGYERYFN